MLKINYLEIVHNKKSNKKLYKNLKPHRFYFHSIEQKIELWGSHVNIQAIVGKNGSGKSSLMDLLYMAINNFAYMFERGHHRAAATSLCYVKGLFVDIGYEIDGEQYVLCCSGDSVKLTALKKNQIIADFKLNTSNGSSEEINDEEICEITKHFFYTVVSNYSLQSFISSNYKCGTYVYNRIERKDDEPENVNSVGLPWDEDVDSSNDTKEKIWLNSVFHKNDGYVRSLVLNPYRDNGRINMETEAKLAKYRLAALLIDGEKNKTTIFRDYVLDRIEFFLDKNFILKKFPEHSVFSLLEYVEKQLEDENSSLSNIVEAFNLKVNRKSNEMQLIALAYLKEKLFKIVENYESYNDYREDGTLSIYGIDCKINLRSLRNQIAIDPSHVVTKAKQTINFLSKNISKTKRRNLYEFTYRTYSKTFVSSFLTMDDIITSFPPPIFRYEIYLNKLISQNVEKNKKYLGVREINEMEKLKNLPKGSFFISARQGMLETKRFGKEHVNKNIIIRWTGNRWDKDEINISDLSSGELQMMYTLSTHAYHIRNLMSIKDESIKYHNINMVFDEVEICFHPEYQRQFISRLISMLNALCRYKQDYNFNVFVLTHSPFILSDLPSSNVLYMDNGKSIKVGAEVFGQNISVLLNQNFFLNFFVGEFAKNKINSLIDFLLTKKRDLGWKKDLALEYIDQIGDQFLKENLKRKYNEAFGK